jgi:putative solute:sodium symporter small subunit
MAHRAAQHEPRRGILILGAGSGFCKGFPVASPRRAGKEAFCRALKKEGSMQLTEKHQQYWRKNLVITAILLFIWFMVTYVEGWYARELNSISFLGFPLGFYMSAQGSLIIYVVIIGIYARYMNNLDRVYGVHEGEDQ